MPSAAEAGENEDPNLWCVFDVIADRLESIDERLEGAQAGRTCRLKAVD